MKLRDDNDALIVNCNNLKCSMRLHFKCVKGDCDFPNFISEILTRLRMPMLFHRIEVNGAITYVCPHCNHWRKFRRVDRIGKWVEVMFNKDKKKPEWIPVKFD